MIVLQDYVNAVSGRGAISVHDLAEKLIPRWCSDYRFTNPRAQLVATTLTERGTWFTYVFDLERSRVVVACGVPIAWREKRRASRIAGSPLADSAKYDRGHMMAHYLGGGEDINLVPQLSKMNRGEFRKVEEMAREETLKNHECLYFVRCIYNSSTQLPTHIEQCLILPPRVLGYKQYPNT